MSQILYVEIYRPKKVSELILPKQIKETLQQIVATGDIPNLLFYGQSGVGKTSVAKAMCEELEYDYLCINASNEGRSLDVLRNDITDFAVGTSLSGKKKVIILDEFCGTSNLVQQALKGFFEQFSSTCSFILTANHKHKIDAPILSRFSELEFKIPKEERGALGVELLKRLMNICQQEGIDADKMALFELTKKYFPDIRKILNELQKYSVSKVFNMESLQSMETPTKKFVDLLKNKKFTDLRGLIASTQNIDIIQVNRELYDIMSDVIDEKSQPTLVVIMADYNYKSAFAQDQEILIMAEFVEIMSSVNFK